MLAGLECSYVALGRIVTKYGRDKNKSRGDNAFSDVCRQRRCQKVTDSAEGKKQRSNCYMQPVKSRCNKEDGTVNVFAPRKLNPVFVLVCLAE